MRYLAVILAITAAATALVAQDGPRGRAIKADQVNVPSVAVNFTNSLTSGAAGYIPFTAADTVSGSTLMVAGYDAASGVFTAPYKGRYLINMRANTTTGVDGRVFTPQLYRFENGVDVGSASFGTSRNFSAGQAVSSAIGGAYVLSTRTTATNVSTFTVGITSSADLSSTNALGARYVIITYLGSGDY